MVHHCGLTAVVVPLHARQCGFTSCAQCRCDFELSMWSKTDICHQPYNVCEAVTTAIAVVSCIAIAVVRRRGRRRRRRRRGRVLSSAVQL